MSKMFYVYLLMDPRDAVVFYVGKGTGGRSRRHVQGYSHSEALRRKIEKLRAEGVEPEVHTFDVGGEEDAFKVERELIRLIGRRDIRKGPLINMTDGGEGASGRRLTAPQLDAIRLMLTVRNKSDAQRKKCGAWHTGKLVSEETRAKMSASKRGVVQSLETRAKRSATLTGMVRSQATRDAISAGRKGMKFTDEHRQNISQAAKGRVLDEQHRAKLSASLKGKVRTAEHRTALAAAQTGKVYSAESRARMSASAKAAWERKRAAGDNAPQEHPTP